MAYLISGSVILDQSRNLVDALDIGATQNANIAGITTTNILNVLNAADITGDVTTDGIQASGIATFLGNVEIGDSIADTLTVLALSTFNNNVAITSNLTVNGTTTVEDLVINGTATIGGTNVGDDISTRNLEVTGIATFQGNVEIGNAVSDTLTVLSNTTFNNNVAISSNLTVNGNTTIGDAASDTLTVNATSTFANYVNVTDDFNVTGIGTIATLGLGAGVLVSSILDEDTMASNSDTALATQQSIKAYVDAQVGAANQLTFTDGTTIGEVELATETLELLGTPNEVTVVVTSAAGVGNTVTFGLPDDVTIGQNLLVTGITTTQDLVVTGTAQINGQDVVSQGDDITATNLLITGISTFQGAVNIGDSVADTLTILSDTTVNNNVAISSNLTVTGNLQVDGNSTLGNAAGDTLTVNATATFVNDASVQGNTTLGNAASDTLTVNATATLNEYTNVDADFNVTGIATIATLGLGAGVLVTSILDEDDLVSNSDTALATQQSIKAYVDAQVGSANQLFFTDGTTTGEIDLAFETMSLLGTPNEITVQVTSEGAGVGNTVTFGLPDDVTITGHLTVGDGASVTGIVTATDFNSTSDINKKENIEVIPDAVAKVNALRGVLFDWKDGSGHSGGVIAQEVEAVLPTLVKEGDHKTVVYNGIIGLLVEAVKELSAEVEALKAHHSA